MVTSIVGDSLAASLPDPIGIAEAVGSLGRVGAVALLGGLLGLGLFLVLLGLLPRAPGDRAGRSKSAPSRRVVARGRPRQDRALRVAATGLAGVVTALLTGWLAGGILVAAACWFLPRLLGRDTAHARRVARIEAIATWTEMIRDTLSAAAGLEQAILAAAPLAPAPIRAEVAALAARLDRGARLVPALRRLAHDLADPTADLVVAALVLATEQHARQLAELLGALAANARERAWMRMRVEAGRARTRTSVRVIVATTTAFAALLVVLNPSYMDAYDSVTGQLVLLAVGSLFAAGFAWLARIAAVPEPDRLLAKSGEFGKTEGSTWENSRVVEP